MAQTLSIAAAVFWAAVLMAVCVARSGTVGGMPANTQSLAPILALNALVTHLETALPKLPTYLTSALATPSSHFACTLDGVMPLFSRQNTAGPTTSTLVSAVARKPGPPGQSLGVLSA